MTARLTCVVRSSGRLGSHRTERSRFAYVGSPPRLPLAHPHLRTRVEGANDPELIPDPLSKLCGTNRSLRETRHDTRAVGRALTSARSDPVRAARICITLGAIAVACCSVFGDAAGQAVPRRPSPPDTNQRRITIERGSRRYPRDEPRLVSRRGRLPDATPAAIASAYHDARAREIIDEARAARFRQDSSLTSYDAVVKQRL